MCDNTQTHDAITSIIPRILIVDHHDSYTLNLLISLSEATQISSSDLLSHVVILPHNHPLLVTPDAFISTLLPHFNALILGPGPGHPKNDSDFGPAKRILESILREEIAIPTLGVCLGHQGIAYACGGQVIEGDSLRHGQVSNIEVVEGMQDQLAWPSLFVHESKAECNNDKLSMVRYNSLTVDEASLPDQLVVTAWSQDTNWATPMPRSNIFSPKADARDTTAARGEGRVVMAIQHKTLPLWGVQFHPESIASQDGCNIMKKFIGNCLLFSRRRHDNGQSSSANAYGRNISLTRSPLPIWIRKLGQPLVSSCSSPHTFSLSASGKGYKMISKRLPKSITRGYDTCSIFQTVFASSTDTTSKVWLDSSRSGDPQNRFSYMAIPSWQALYSREDGKVYVCGQDRRRILGSFDLRGKDFRSSAIDVVHGLMTPKSSRSNSPETIRETERADFWSWMAAIQESFQASLIQDDCRDVPPFRSGFVGYFDYEMKSESLTRGKEILKHNGLPQINTASHQGLPSAWFGFCDRLLAYDHKEDEWWASSLIRLPGEAIDGDEISMLKDVLNDSGIRIGLTADESDEWYTELQDSLGATPVDTRVKESSLPPLASLNAADEYQDKIEAARAYIRRGDSYEICITTQFTGRLPETYSGNSFDLYKSLRQKNPAPYSAYLDLGNGQSILSTSPERFMSIEANGRVEMRPIKGTLARAGYKVGEESIRMAKENGDKDSIAWCRMEDERRRAALNCDPKEKAENLMIVDLIRADLLSFCSPDSVQVPALMQVESYESVHQLVTTVTGQKEVSVSSIQALKNCFPPGSMTGAPKVRSVDILEKLEQRDRGVYSGILGWIGLDGAASTSVVIRTIVIDGHNVSVGAGGAITYLSEAEKEWQEVLDKVKAIATIEEETDT